MTTDSSDEFDNLDIPELTAEDWQLVDAQADSILQSLSPAASEPQAGPSTPTRRSSSGNYTSPRARRPKYASPTPAPMQAARALSRGTVDLFSAFRPAGTLSVSDLVGPAWCEVKFDYNLRWGRRWDRVDRKPQVVVTSKGKEIEVRKDQAQKSERIKAAGSAVHKKLERALQPVEIEIPVNTREERWGSKLLTMLSGLQLLRSVGYCREFPVMGFIGNVMIIGIIDEIVRKPLTNASTSYILEHKHDTRPQTPPRTDQPLISEYFSPTKSQLSQPTISNPVTPHAPLDTQTYTLRLIDNKTRNSKSVPSQRDQIQSRLQLMLYKRLLDPLIDPTSFIDVMHRLEVDTSASFSPAFLQTQEYLCDANQLSETTRSAMCLADLMVAWVEALETLQLSSHSDLKSEESTPATAVDGTLELVYRLRAAAAPKKKVAQPISREASWNTESEAVPREAAFGVDVGVISPPVLGGSVPSSWPSGSGVDADDAAMAWAIQESLKPAYQNALVYGSGLESNGDSNTLQNVSSTPGAGASKTPTTPPPPPSSSTVQVPLSNSQEKKVEPTDEGKEGTASTSTPTPSLPSHVRRSESNMAPVVGNSTFEYDAEYLDEYLTAIMQFWRGEREPQGVEIEDANRCNFCEFRDGCEWREAKADEEMETRRAAYA